MLNGRLQRPFVHQATLLPPLLGWIDRQCAPLFMVANVVEKRIMTTTKQVTIVKLSTFYFANERVLNYNKLVFIT